jgi:hypothetical protein
MRALSCWIFIDRVRLKKIGLNQLGVYHGDLRIDQ